MKPVVAPPAAKEDVREAVAYYQAPVSGLGLDLWNEITATVVKIRVQPDRSPVRADGTRKRLVNRFPYSVVYVDFTDRVWIVALAHAKRKPGYWQNRLA